MQAEPSAPEEQRPRVAIVIGSGGIKCMAAVGMWKVLARAGIQADLAVGCSGGSLIAALIALGTPVEQAERHALELWDGLFAQWNYRAMARSLLSHWLGFSERFGMVNDRRVNQAMQLFFGDARFTDTRMPLYLTASTVLGGEVRYLHQGLIRDAARASIAIPLLLRPWRVDGELLMDGGTADPLPVSVAIREGADIILAMGFETPPRASLQSPLHYASQAMTVTINNLLRSTYAFYSAAHHAELVPLMPQFSQAIRPNDTHLLPHIIEQGEKITEAQLPYLQRLLARPHTVQLEPQVAP